MSAFGHTARPLAGGGMMDSWGIGPFELDVAGQRHRFEDSDQFGPVKLNRAGELSSAKPWGSRHPFWEAHRQWVRAGRLVAEDGVTCVFQRPPRPTVVSMISKRSAIVILHGDDDGPTVTMDSPEGQAALREADWAGRLHASDPPPTPGPGA